MRSFQRYLPALAALLFASVVVAAEEPFQSGRDYLELSNPQPVEVADKIEVREFFWYGCPHCYILEGPLAAYVRKLPKNVRFVRTPGVSPNWIMQAQAYYAFEALGLTEKLHKPFFDAWHGKDRRLSDEATITAFVVEHGVDAAKFKEAFNSFGVRARLERAKQQNIAYVVESVPLLAVDGRYVTSPQMGGGTEKGDVARSQRALKVVDFLIEKAAQERKKAAR